MSSRIWSSDCTTWSAACWLWSDCGAPPVVEVQSPGVDATELMQPWLEEPWNPYKAGQEDARRRRLIHLIAKVKGKEFKEEKMRKDSKVTVDEIKMLIKDRNNIDIDLKLE